MVIDLRFLSPVSTARRSVVFDSKLELNGLYDADRPSVEDESTLGSYHAASHP